MRNAFFLEHSSSYGIKLSDWKKCRLMHFDVLFYRQVFGHLTILHNFLNTSLIYKTSHIQINMFEQLKPIYYFKIQLKKIT
jgi:hypothetical protein